MSGDRTRPPPTAGPRNVTTSRRQQPLGWVARLARTRAVRLTDDGRARLADQFGVAVS